jgi:hypothetical protein
MSKMLDFMRNEAEGRADEREQDIAIALHSIKVDMEGKRLDAHASAGMMSMLLGGFTFTVFLEGPAPADFEEKTSLWLGYVYITTMTLVFVLNLFAAVVSSTHFSFGSRLLSYRYGMLSGVSAFRKLLRADLSGNRRDNAAFTLGLPPAFSRQYPGGGGDLEQGGAATPQRGLRARAAARRWCCGACSARASPAAAAGGGSGGSGTRGRWAPMPLRSPHAAAADAVAAMPFDFNRFHNSTLAVRRLASTAFQISVPLFMLGMALLMFNMMSAGPAIVQSCVIGLSFLSTACAIAILVRKYFQELPGGRGRGGRADGGADAEAGKGGRTGLSAPTPTHSISDHASPKVHPLLATFTSSTVMTSEIKKAGRRISRSFSSAALDLPNFGESDAAEDDGTQRNPRRRKRGSGSSNSSNGTNGSRADMPKHLRKFASQRTISISTGALSSSDSGSTTMGATEAIAEEGEEGGEQTRTPAVLRREQSMPALGSARSGFASAGLSVDCAPLPKRTGGVSRRESNDL